MKKFLSLLAITFSGISFAQFSEHYAPFPQTQINKAAHLASEGKLTPVKASQNKIMQGSSSSNVMQLLKKIKEVKSTSQKYASTQWVQLHDTIVVGATPGDTLRITGNWTHNGPILVLNDGVLIFKNATVVDTGDIYLVQHAKLLADSSSLTFPQFYFYQRSLIAIQSSYAQISNCSFDYSGMSHNLVLGDSSQMIMKNIHQRDFTTCGLFKSPTLSIDGCNLAGEYIIEDSCHVNFKHCDTLLLWHHFPKGASVNYSFPSGANLNTYTFNNSIPGISGVNYHIQTDTSTNVWWGMMPENGTNVTISNSTIRTIGNWFRYGDTAHVANLNDNSSYTNFVAPLTDRNLHLINSDVETWSLYVFDVSKITVDSCTVGEIGTESHSSCEATPPFLCDGSGGYFWASDTSSVFALGATDYSYARAEKNGIFFLAYGWLPYTAPTSIGSGVIISVQSTAADPVPLEEGTAWLAKIDSPDTSYTNMIVPVNGSAWIDWGTNGSGWLDFASYSMYYQLNGSSTWTRILQDSMTEIRHAVLKNWNTLGLATGNYNVKLTVKDNFGDSVEAVKNIYLKTGTTGIAAHAVADQLKIYPNPASGVLNIQLADHANCITEVYDAMGRKVFSQPIQAELSQVDFSAFEKGLYQVRITRNNLVIYQGKIVRQ
jgi:hypothetical protein